MTGFRIEKHGEVLEIVLDRPTANASIHISGQASSQRKAVFSALAVT